MVRILAGLTWIAHDGLRLTLAKPIEVLVADGSGRGTYLPIALAGIKMPVENDSITVANRRFFCVDPRDGAAVFEFAKPRNIGLVQSSDDRETICVGSLAIDPEARPLLERLECELQIDHDYIAHATLRSLGRQEATQIEFHQLEFGLALPSPSGTIAATTLINDKVPSVGTQRSSAASLAQKSAGRSNITLRSNLAPKSDDWRVHPGDWELVPGDLLDDWTTDFLGPRSAKCRQCRRMSATIICPVAGAGDRFT
jgi:molecular chaperone DnaK